MFNWPIFEWFLSLFPKPKVYRVVEDKDGIGYHLVEDVEDDDVEG